VHDDGFLIIDVDQPHNSIIVADTAALLQLRKRINDAVDTLQTDGIAEEQPLAKDVSMITTAEARAKAEEQGQPLHNDTLLMAIKAGSIPGAEKDGGRWKMPRWAFEQWLNRIVAKRARLAAQK